MSGKLITKPEIYIDLEKVEKLAGLGLTLEQIADSMGISPRTLHRHKKRRADLAEAIRRGQNKGIALVANGLFVNATVKKNPAAQMFYLKTRAGWKETERHEISDPDGKPLKAQVVQIYLPDNGRGNGTKPA